MKRKLIDFDVFNKLEQGSLTTAEYELAEAEDVVSHALGKDVKMHCLSDSTVLYQTPDDTYVHATYQMDKEALTLENIEELVVDETQERENAKGILGKMIDQLLEGEEGKANVLFEEYIDLPFVRRTFNEMKIMKVRVKKGRHRAGQSMRSRKGHRTAKRQANRPERRRRSQMLQRYSRTHKTPKGYRLVVKENTANALMNISENVLRYVDYRHLGPTLDECNARYDDQGNVTALRIPRTNLRNEGKILKLKYNVLTHELTYHRAASKGLGENTEFCSAVAHLKRQNTFNDSNALQETLENIVTQWPNVIYLSQSELSKMLGEALETAGVKNYDDQICNFMAEGILRTAFDVHKDKVEKILKIAKNPECEGYDCFQETVEGFYPYMDEATSLEMQAFYDLYTAVGEIYNQARRTGDEVVGEQAESFMRDLHAVCEGQMEPDVELAEEVAEWVQYLIETNLETSSWNVSNSTHQTVSGDHPQMAKNAATGYTPRSDFSGNWGDVAPVSDGKNYKGGLADQMRSRAWANVGGPDTFPSLNNPYVPKPFGDYTMKGEPGVDKTSDSGLTQVQNSDTWPNLQNPYVPRAETPQTYKMNKGKEQDLVIDK